MVRAAVPALGQRGGSVPRSPGPRPRPTFEPARHRRIRLGSDSGVLKSTQGPSRPTRRRRPCPNDPNSRRARLRFSVLPSLKRTRPRRPEGLRPFYAVADARERYPRRIRNEPDPRASFRRAPKYGPKELRTPAPTVNPLRKKNTRPGPLPNLDPMRAESRCPPRTGTPPGLGQNRRKPLAGGRGFRAVSRPLGVGAKRISRQAPPPGSVSGATPATRPLT